MDEEYITAVQLAELTGISRQMAAKACRNALAGKPWKGHQLAVRVIPGTAGGGRSGTHYEVALSSLSNDLQRAFLGSLDEPPPHPLIGCGYTPAPNQNAKIERRWRVIQEAIETPHRSPERRAEVLRASKKWNIPTRTIYRWIADLEASGGDVNALAHKKPADAGQRRVWVSRTFDAAFVAAGHPEALLPELGARVDELICAAWAGPTQRAGWKQVRREVITAFQRDCRERGLAVPGTAFELSQRRIMQSQHYRMGDIYANDRKRFDDMKPRIRRDNSKFAPMEQIVMDVKPLDCIVRRPDGTTSWPKMIAFMDTGTHRVFRHFVLLPKGEGVRQEHVAEAFIRMAMHPEWGFPQSLYRDNGTEFYIMDMVRDALALINEPGARTIINAKPYSGASKPIESKFAVLDRFVFSQMGGWAGGERMNKKTQTVGKPPKPYAGSFEEFVEEANERIEIFEHELIGSGPFKGKSPQGCFAEHIANGWRPIRVDVLALDAAFCKRATGRPDRGALKINGELFRHPQLPNRQQVTIALPWRRGALPLVDIPGLGWAALIPDMQFLPGDISGAIESGRMQRHNDRAARGLSKSARAIDLEANRRDRVIALPTRAAPAPIMDALASQQAQEMAAARLAGDEAVAALPSAAERHRAKRLRELERLERMGYGLPKR